jgi:hypothetical protein
VLVGTSGACFNVVASDVRCWAASRKRRYQFPEKGVISPDELLSSLKRYLEESGATEQVVACKIGVNHHTLHRWLSDNQIPKRGGRKLALTALFLRRGILISIPGALERHAANGQIRFDEAREPLAFEPRTSLTDFSFLPNGSFLRRIRPHSRSGANDTMRVTNT